MGLLEIPKLIKKIPDPEANCREILANCEDPNHPFPSYAEEYDFAAYLYDKLSAEDETYPHKAYTNALEAIRLGYHTTQNLLIVSWYSYSTMNLVGLKQVGALIYNEKFCYRHTPTAGYLYNKIVEWVKELSEKVPGSGFSLFTQEEIKEILKCCKKHLDVISDWEMYTKMEKDGIRHEYAGVRFARNALYNLDYEGINIGYGYDGCSSYYDDLKKLMDFVYRRSRNP